MEGYLQLTNVGMRRRTGPGMSSIQYFCTSRACMDKLSGNSVSNLGRGVMNFAMSRTRA